ncbi:pyridoxal phosphate-dependent transferase [Aspergillus pseudoustus]|uniref:Aspartate aminotransferase n=1 Tax=Aspergillus pseudoustus TaxID=1810923 RepID=A0ABR4JV41_9EURO
MGSLGEPPLLEPQDHSQSLFSSLAQTPPDEPFSVNEAYMLDAHPQKVNLGIGVYRTSSGSPWPLPVVEEAERELREARNIHRHEYLAIQGDREFLRLAADLVFGFGQRRPHAGPANEGEKQQQRVVSIQTVSGTGANRLGAELLARTVVPGCVWVPDPSWANHQTIWNLAGVPVNTYPYYNAKTRTFDFDGTLQCLRGSAKANDVVVFHACAHNPTGADPTQEQWATLAQLCKQKRLIPFFDLAYQGFASGDVDRDAWAIRHFFELVPELEFCVAQSFSKNFGLYGQRVGALHVALSPATNMTGASDRLLGCLCNLVRGDYSMAPRAGAEIVRTVLGNELLRTKWVDDLTTMSERIQRMRYALYNELMQLNTPGDWKHIVNQIGMFTYIGLSETQVWSLRDRYHIYMLKSGRISISGLNERNVGYVAKGIDDVVRTVK